MKLLVIDTSNWPLGVAVLENGVVLGEINSYISKNHSLRLMPAIEQLFKELNLKPAELDGIGVAQGPGSYTGVRIGVTTAKTLAWSLRVPLVGISSLQVIAQGAAGFPGVIVPMIDARRGQVYRGCYRWDEEAGIVMEQEVDQLQLVSDMVEELKEKNTPILFIGEGALAHQELVKECGLHAQLASGLQHKPRAAHLGLLASYYWDSRAVKEIHAFAPEYLQLAEAEANWNAKQKGSC